jgi:chemotaxis protein MotA
MAGKPAAKKPDTAAPKAAAKPAGLRPDASTLAGILLAFAGIVGGLILEKGKIQDIMQVTAAMIVLGGTMGAVLVTTPLPVVLRAFAAMKGVFFERASSIPATIDEIIAFATKARKNGIVSLEQETDNVRDPFLRKALNLAVDGTDLQEMRKMMELEISMFEHAADAESKVWEAAGGYAPTIGIIGAVLGLIQVMKKLDDIKEVGSGIAVAFVATVYGVGMANIFFLPAAAKLKARAQEALLLKELMLEGVIGIVEGLNPTLIRMKLEAYNHGAKPAKPAKDAGEPAAAKSAA